MTEPLLFVLKGQYSRSRDISLVPRGTTLCVHFTLKLPHALVEPARHALSRWGIFCTTPWPVTTADIYWKDNTVRFRMLLTVLGLGRSAGDFGDRLLLLVQKKLEEHFAKYGLHTESFICLESSR